ncbi:MAG: hypothetical protein EBR15_09005 [Gammaproteobacteria bacterium]|nr:hypothetical protein [Gammaproteobacteria bacterium]
MENGRPLDRFANPFTQATVRVAHYRSPQKLRFIGNRIEPAQAMPPGVEFRGEIRRLAAVAGRVAVTEDLYVRMPAVPATETRPARAVRYANSLATFHGAERDLSRPARVWLPCEFSYTTLNSFASWLEMDGVAGVQDMRITGAKCRVDQRETISSPCGTKSDSALRSTTFFSSSMCSSTVTRSRKIQSSASSSVFMRITSSSSIWPR